MSSVGIRALQQNASAVVARAERGEVIDITDHGRLVARIVPAHATSQLERLAAAGQLKAATTSLADLPSPLRHKGRSASEILEEMRADER